MSEKLAIIDGRICRIISVEDHGPDLVKVQMVTGTRTRRATAGKRPGPKWRPDPSGNPRKWVAHTDVVDELIIKRDHVIQGGWPVGWEDFGNDPDELVVAVKQTMRRALEAGGARARRKRPDINPLTLEPMFKRDGLPMPTEAELDQALHSAWEDLNPRNNNRGKGAKGGGRTIIPPKPRKKTDVGDEIPEGVEIDDNQFWCAALEMALDDNEDGRLMHRAATENGWPAEFLEGAQRRRRGLKGFTLAYATKNKYDPEKHGEVEKGPPPIETSTSKKDDEPDSTEVEVEEEAEDEGKSDTSPTSQSDSSRDEDTQTEDSSSSEKSDEGEK